jgi:hypothetical protein
MVSKPLRLLPLFHQRFSEGKGLFRTGVIRSQTEKDSQATPQPHKIPYLRGYF